MSEPALVIAIGHPYRGDDSAGLAVLERLREREGLRATEGAALTPAMELLALADPLDLVDLLERRAPQRRVIVVDAAVGSIAPGSVRVFAAADPLLGSGLGSRAMSSHGLGVAAAIALARATLGDRALDDAHVVAIGIAPPARAPSAALSPEATAAIPLAVAAVARLLDHP